MQKLFNTDDAGASPKTRVPQHMIGDRIAWSRSNDGLYTVKSGYRMWHDQNVGSPAVPQSGGWNKGWFSPQDEDIYLAFLS